MQNTSENTATAQTRGSIYSKKIAKEVAKQIGLVTFLWFVFWAALHA